MTATMDNQSLLRKYRPKRLKDILGQPDVTRALRAFVKAPYPTPMLFHGETGIGKTSAAFVLAVELGCPINRLPREQWDLAGVYSIPSGDMKAEDVKAAVGRVSHRPFFGEGWRVLICNEAERMSTAAENIWMDALDEHNIPPMTVFIFTSNALHKFSKRFRDRCECYAFESDTARLRPAIRKLAMKVWKAEKLKGKPPGLESLGLPSLNGPDALFASFRLAMQQLQKYVREAKTHGVNGNMKRLEKCMAKDLEVGVEYEANCDHCGAPNDIVLGQTKHTCSSCGQEFRLVE